MNSFPVRINNLFIRNFVLLFLIFILAGKSFCLEESQPNGKFTYPLLRYINIKEILPFEYKLTPIIQAMKKKGMYTDISMYFQDLYSGMAFGINEDEEFIPASILKIPIMMAYFKIAETDPEILGRILKYEAGKQNITYPQHAISKEYYSADELIKIMIKTSDNTAADVLASHLSNSYLNATFLNLGIIHQGELEGMSSVIEIASLLRILYNASYLNESMSDRALQYLSETDYIDGIVAGIPKDIKIAHKYGERYLSGLGAGELHDAAIVYYPNCPYSLVVMTRGKEYKQLEKVIKIISKFVYDEVDIQCSAGSFQNTQFLK